MLTSHKAEEVQKRSREIIKKMQDIAKKTHEQEINTIVAKDFNQNEAEAREARSILEANYDNAEQEYKRRVKDVNNRIMDIIGPVLKELKSGMRQGVDIVRVEGERDAHYEKVSNNDEWARNYYEDYGHWPNERELVDLAIDIAAGRQNPRYGLMDYLNNTEESRQHFEAQAAALDELVERRNLLEGMKDRFEGMKAGDRAAQAMLSPEGMEVYELAKKEFAASQNKEVRAAAKEQALAYARYCDLMAQNYAEVYNKPFTAKDYMNEILHVNVNAVEGKAPMQNAAQPYLNFSSREDDLNLVKDILTANYENPREEIKNRSIAVESAIAKILQPIYDELEKHQKSNDEWYKKYIEMLGYKNVHVELKPDDMLEIAKRVIRGEPVKVPVPGYENAEENKTRFADAAKELERLYDQRRLLMGLNNNGRNGIPSIDDYKKIYDREGGTFNFPKPQQTDKYFQVSAEEFERQKSEVRKQYKGTDQWMKAPNGKPTNLNEDQWVTVRTAAFKNWFGDWENDPANASKIVDENGEPLVVYHGTPYGGFEEFQKGRQAYFTPMEWYANKYQTPGASAIRNRYDEATQPQTYPVFLNIRKPFDTRNAAERKIWDEEYYRQWGTGAPLGDKGLPDWTDGLDLQEFFEENEYDYDGLLLDEGGFPDGKGGVTDRGISYVTFEPNQIKDATGRNVGFNPESGNVYLQNAGEETVAANQNGQNLDLNNKEEVAKFLSQLTYESIPVFSLAEEVENEIQKSTKEELLSRAVSTVNNLIGKEIEDPLGSKLYFEPGEEGDLQKYVLHLLAGKNNGGDISNIHNRRVIALELAERTLKEPLAIIIENARDEEGNEIVGEPGRKVYLSMYKGEGYNANSIIVEVERSEEGRVVTSFAVAGGKKDKKKALREFKKSLNAAVQILYLRTGLSGHSRLASGQTASLGNASLHTSGNQIISQETNTDNENLNQQQGSVKGSTSFSETSPLKVVSLFQTADRSTFMHEMSHVYLLDLERLAAAAPDSRFAKDYATVMAWASWKKGRAEEYKGTASYEEFKKREQNILEAQIKGDTETEQKLLNEWAQERFARGFEEYLRKGEAPAVGLQNAFRNFKRWLTKIYKSFIGAGVRATPEVEAVMGRMLASEEEIQVMNEIMEGNRLAGLDGLDMMPTDVAAMYSRWQEKAHTQAEEQLLKELLKDYKKNVQDRMQEHEEALREEITARLQQDEPCYAVDEAVADGTDLNSALFMFNMTSREYEKRKKELGGDLEKAVEKQVKKEMEEFRRQMPDDKMLHDQAMQALYSGDYQTRLAELERKILRAYKDRYMEAPQMLQKAVSHQQQITDGIKDAEHTSAGIGETSKAIAESARHIETGVGEAAGLIDSCQQILGRIRNRGQTGTTPY